MRPTGVESDRRLAVRGRWIASDADDHVIVHPITLPSGQVATVSFVVSVVVSFVMSARCRRAGRYRGGMPGAQLIVIRHGETEWSKQGRHTGRTDIELTERGRHEATDAARTLDGWSVDRAYTSPLSRARETAELVAPSCGLAVDDSLVEWDYGVFEGETTAQTRERIAGWSVWTHEIVGGESVADVGARADAFLERFDREVDGGSAVVFAHGHFLAILIARWCRLPAVEGRRFALATATVSLLGWHREDRVVRAINHRCGDALHPPERR